MPKYIVRYGAMRLLATLSTRGGANYQRNALVIARTNRGLEAGEVLCESRERANEKQEKPTQGQILREMTADDANELAHIEASAKKEFEICRQHVQSLDLRMQLVDLEHLFGGERVIIYYLADGRVDFRELVKRLASEFQTRIEMRQIGVRDEAKLLADFGDCGKPGLLQLALDGNAPGIDENGEDAEGDTGPDQDLRPLRSAEMLPAI